MGKPFQTSEIMMLKTRFSSVKQETKNLSESEIFQMFDQNRSQLTDDVDKETLTINFDSLLKFKQEEIKTIEI